MMSAFFWGVLATCSLIVGGIIALRYTLSHRALGVIMAFGAGALISAVSYELIGDAISIARGTGFPMMGLFAGALTFYYSDKLVAMVGPSNPHEIAPSSQSSLLIPMVLAIILDGVPESIVIGLGIFKEGAVSLPMLVAVFLSNLPEAIAGTIGMKASGWSKLKIITLWVVIVLVCGLATVAGSTLFTGVSVRWLAFIQAFAGGAILLMLANSMMPEAYEHGGKLAGIFTVLGFFVSVAIIVLESMHG
jgi:ZIP family zinc transporter